MQRSQTEVKFNLDISQIPEAVKLEAEKKAKEAYVMTLLRHHEISSGRAAEILGIPRVETIDLMTEYGISPFPNQTREELEQEVSETLRMNVENNIMPSEKYPKNSSSEIPQDSEVWKAYLAVEQKWEEVFRRLADS